MSVFSYRARKKNEVEIFEGLVEAESESLAVEILEERGFLVLFLENKKSSFGQIDILNKVKAKDLVILSRQLSILISAGVPVVEALKDVVNQTKNKKLKKTIMDVAIEVEGGVKFSEALSNHSKIFDSFFVNIIKSGEVSGRLEEVLLYLADQLEKDYELKSKIKGAMIYPVFVVGALVVIGVLMMIFVVPNLIEMLEQTGGELPFSTQILKNISDFMVSYWWTLIILAGVLFEMGHLIVKNEKGKKVLDNIKLRLPIFGKLFNYISIIRFSRSLRTLQLGGVDLVSSLDITASMVGNLVYADLINQTKLTVEGGGEFGEVFSSSPIIPNMVPQMLDTGEQTGKINEVLEKISEFYTREANILIANLMSLLEPVIMIVLGVAVGLMVTSIILPMYQISSNM